VAGYDWYNLIIGLVVCANDSDLQKSIGGIVFSSEDFIYNDKRY
jgi:hypothetical protein